MEKEQKPQIFGEEFQMLKEKLKYVFTVLKFCQNFNIFYLPSLENCHLSLQRNIQVTLFIIRIEITRVAPDTDLPDNWQIFLPAK